MTTNQRIQTEVVKTLTDAPMFKLLQVENLFRLMDEEVPAQVVVVFCFVASHNPCHMQAIEEEIGLTPNSVSRNSDWLSTHHRLGKPGMGLIEKFTDPNNQRRKMLRLTSKGETLANHIKEVLYGVRTKGH